MVRGAKSCENFKSAKRNWIERVRLSHVGGKAGLFLIEMIETLSTVTIYDNIKSLVFKQEALKWSTMVKVQARWELWNGGL